MNTPKKRARKFSPTSRYPVGYRCEHCGNSGFTARDGETCPTCRFGALVKMTWNGLAWH